MSNYNFLDMLMGKANQATQKDPNQLLSPAKRFGKGLDALVLRGYGIGDQIVEQANKQTAFDLQSRQRQDTLTALKQRADSGDKVAAQVLMAVENRSLQPSDAMKIYFREKFNRTGTTTPAKIQMYEYAKNVLGKSPEEAEIFANTAPTTNINTQQNYENKALVDRGLKFTDALLDAGELAKRSQFNTRKQIQLINDPSFDAGAGNELVVLGKRVLNRLGMVPDSEIASNEQFITYMRSDVLNKLGGSLGVGISASDVDYLNNMVANPNMTKQAMRDILFAADALYQRQIEIVDFANDYMNRTGNQFIRDRNKFNQELQDKFGNINMFQVTSQG